MTSLECMSFLVYRDITAQSHWHTWALEVFFQWGPLGDFSKLFQGRAKSGEICFLPLKIEKTTFCCWKFLNPGGTLAPLPPFQHPCWHRQVLSLPQWSTINTTYIFNALCHFGPCNALKYSKLEISCMLDIYRIT